MEAERDPKSEVGFAGARRPPALQARAVPEATGGGCGSARQRSFPLQRQAVPEPGRRGRRTARRRAARSTFPAADRARPGLARACRPSSVQGQAVPEEEGRGGATAQRRAAWSRGPPPVRGRSGVARSGATSPVSHCPESRNPALRRWWPLPRPQAPPPGLHLYAEVTTRRERARRATPLRGGVRIRASAAAHGCVRAHQRRWAEWCGLRLRAGVPVHRFYLAQCGAGLLQRVRGLPQCFSGLG